MKNIYAHTEPGGSYPGFISANEAGPHLSVTVRSPRGDDGACGAIGAIELSPGEAEALGQALIAWAKERTVPLTAVQRSVLEGSFSVCSADER